MITSALITECRREYEDTKKTTRVVQDGDSSTTLFNVGHYPIIENSYSVYKGTSGQTETTDYSIDLDNGDITFVSAPGNIEVKAEFQHAHWRDKNWVEAINQAIEDLNGKGFFKQVVRDSSVMTLSAGVRTMSGPTNAIDVYEILESSNYTTSGSPQRLQTNWSYQQDANKVILGGAPSRANVLWTSYLRNLKTYSTTSATVDVLDQWKELVKKRAGAIYFRSLAAKIAKQGNATIDEGHFSFSNLRTMANDLNTEFEIGAARKKPTRPAKDMQYHIESSGVA